MPDAATGQRAPRRPPLLVFVHIPKTAGTTMTAILNMNEPGRRSRGIANVFKGGGGIKEEARFKRLHSERAVNIDQLRVVHGHFPLGMREQFPRRLPRKRELRCFTILRDPTDRMLSHYYAILENRQAREGSSGERRLPELPPDATLEEALEGRYVHDNLQTRMLSGLAEPFGEVDGAMLEQAKHNLREELVFFGLTERFDESLVLAGRRLGLNTILYTESGGRSSKSTGRVNTRRPRGDAVPVELREAAERANRYDIELYSYAKGLFDEIEELRDFEFQVELAALRAAKVVGEIDLDTPPPAGYDGDEEKWRMLVHARATALRRDRKLAETWAVAYELAQDDPGVLVSLGRMKEMQSAEEAEAQLARKNRRKAVRALRRALDDESPPPGRARKPRKRGSGGVTGNGGG